MEEYPSVPDKFIRKLARQNGLTIPRGTTLDELLKSMWELGLEGHLDYLESQFRFTRDMTAFTICKPDSSFPDSTKTPQQFVKSIVERKYIQQGQLDSFWQPDLRPQLQVCGIVLDGPDIFLNIVERKSQNKREQYKRVTTTFAAISSVVIHFSGEQSFELRCPHGDVKKNAEFVMELLGYGDKTKWFPVTRCTKEEVAKIAEILGAMLKSREVAIPSTVGSVRLNASDKDVDLRIDEVCGAILAAIEGSTGLPTNDTMGEVCSFQFTDPRTEIVMPVSFEMNLKTGSFRFTNDVSEAAIQTVVDAFIRVCYLDKQEQTG